MALFRVEVTAYSRKGNNPVQLAAYRAAEAVPELDATTLAAYRAGAAVADQGTGKVHDFRRRGGVVESFIVLPKGAPGWASDRSRLWSEVGLVERRKDAVLAREVLMETPPELPAEERKRMVLEHAEWLAERFQTAVDVALHMPTKHQDPRHFHTHLLMPARVLTPDGFGRKLRELDMRQGGRKHVEAIREHVAGVTNAALHRAGLDITLNHRSVRRQASEVRADDARQDRAAIDATPALSPTEKTIRLQARAAWREEDRARLLAQDPVCWSTSTRTLAAEREAREVAAREVGAIRRAVVKRRAAAVQRRTKWQVRTAEDERAIRFAAKVDNAKAAIDRPARLAELEAEIARTGHVVRAVAARLDVGLAVDAHAEFMAKAAQAQAAVAKAWPRDQGLGR